MDNQKEKITETSRSKTPDRRFRANQKKSQHEGYQFKAGVDFTHCEKGRCRHCTDHQRRHCEKEAEEILNKFPKNK